MIKKQPKSGLKEPNFSKMFKMKNDFDSMFDAMVKDIDPKAREAFFKEVKDVTTKAFLHDHEFTAAIMFQEKAHLFGKVGMMHFESFPESGDDKAKVVAFAGTKLAMIFPDIQFFCFAAEAWMSKQTKVRPSKSADKEEVLILSANDLAMNTRVAMYKIIRYYVDGKEMIDLKEVIPDEKSDKWVEFKMSQTEGFRSRMNMSLMIAFMLSVMVVKAKPTLTEENVFELIKPLV